MVIVLAALKALAVGTLATGVLAYAAVAGLAVVVQAGTSSQLHVAIGPLVVVAVERSGNASSTTLGPGLIVLAVAGGLLNALAAQLLSRRRP